MSAAAVSPAARSRALSLTGLRLIIVAIALVPVAALGVPSEIPLEPRVFAAVLWVLCLAPAWHYLQLPERRRPPVPFLPLIGAVNVSSALAFDAGVYLAVVGMVLMAFEAFGDDPAGAAA